MRPDTSIFCIFFFLCGSLMICIAAPQNKEFVDTFVRETTPRSETNKERPVLIDTGPETLPVWFWQLPTSDSAVIYSIGVSDPSVVGSKGREQAIARACMLSYMMCGVNVSGVADNYSKKDLGKFEELNKFGPRQNCNLRFSPVDSFITKFNEYIVLLKCERDNTQQSVALISSEQYKSVLSTSSGWQEYQKTTYCFKKDSIALSYSYMNANNEFQTISVFNDSTIEVPLGMYSYSYGSDKRISLPHKGIWFGFIQGLTNSLVEVSSRLRSKTQNVDQLVNNQIQQNNRNVFNNNFSFYLYQIAVKDEIIQVEIKVNK